MRLRAGSTEPVPKALRVLCGRTLLQRSVDALSRYADEIIVAVPPDLVDGLDITAASARVALVAGGTTRQQSVRNALDALSGTVELVLVHDAARPLVPAEMVRRVLDALHGGAGCVVPAIAPHDSLRLVTDDGSNAPLDRSRARLVQTPQGFAIDALRRAHASAGTTAATDDATLVERAGEAVTLVEGDPLAFKITRPTDLLLAELLLAGG